jgi:hypothetical protein
MHQLVSLPHQAVDAGRWALRLPLLRQDKQCEVARAVVGRGHYTVTQYCPQTV